MEMVVVTLAKKAFCFSPVVLQAAMLISMRAVTPAINGAPLSSAPLSFTRQSRKGSSITQAVTRNE